MAKVLPGIFSFYKKNIHARITQPFLLKIISLYSNAFFLSSWQVTDASSIKRFHLDSVASSGHHI
jgi:hypothetical protein